MVTELRGISTGMTFLVIAAIGLVLLTILLFPVVGIAMIPVAVVALVALLAWVFILGRRGPRGLPERTTSPDEPPIRG